MQKRALFPDFKFHIPQVGTKNGRASAILLVNNRLCGKLFLLVRIMPDYNCRVAPVAFSVADLNPNRGGGLGGGVILPPV